MSDDPILLLKRGECWIQTGSIKILHPINLTTIETNVISMNKIARQIDNNHPISQLVIQKSRALLNNLRQVKPIQSRRQRRWDSLGTAWKWLAGNPDAEDLRIINNTMNKLIDENNMQVKINRMINNRMEEMADAINTLIEHQNLENKILLEEYDSLTLLLYMDTTNKILEEIQDTIIKTKIALPNSKLLTLHEILLIESLLHEQGITTQFPEQALEYVEPKIALKDDLLLYILQVPKLRKNPSEIIQVIPLIVNDTIIYNLSPQIIRTDKKLFETTKPNNLIQRSSELRLLKDKCLNGIVNGKASHCNVVRENNTFVNLISDNKILINNAKHATIGSTCGPDNRTLTGNYLVTFSNCSVTIDGELFITKEVISNSTEEIQGAFPNLWINRNIIEVHNISTLTDHAIFTRNQLNSMHLQQYPHGSWIFGIFGGLSITSITIFVLITYVCIRRKKVTIKISQHKPRTKKSNPESGNRSEKVHHKDEDVLSLPPGGVTASQGHSSSFECTRSAQ